MSPLAPHAADIRSTASKGDSLHIVHGVLSLDVGGLERIVLDLTRFGSEAGHRVSVVCIERPGVLADEARRLGAEVYSLDKPSGRYAATIAKAADLLSDIEPNVIHTHQIGALWYLGQAKSRQRQQAIIHTEHGNHIAQTRSLVKRLKTRMIIRRASRFADRFCCVSEDIARTVTRFRTVARNKVQVVLNGIDTQAIADQTESDDVRRRFGIPADAKVVGTVGRLSEIKQQALLLRAFARLRNRFPETHVVIVGDGPERARLESEASTLGIASQVHFAGYQANPWPFFKAMNIFVLTSRSEGLPVSLLEAWATGLPVVSSAVGGIPNLVIDGQDGILFPPSDLNALTQAVESVLSNDSLASALGQRGRATVVERYSLGRMAADYDHLYRMFTVTNPERS